MELSAHVLSGEVGVCEFAALVSAAYMMARGAGPWYGHDPQPSGAALFVAKYWYTQPDPTPTARFMFSLQDLQNPAVRGIVAGRRLLKAYYCAGGLAVLVYD